MKFVKKVFILLTVSTLILSFSACSTNKTNSNSSSQSNNSTKDLTIKVNNKIDLTNKQEQLKNSKTTQVSPSFMRPYLTFEQLNEGSQEIIECTIKNVEFFIENGIPYHKIDVEVNDILKGDLKVGDLVSIIQFGGYMTLQDEVDAFDNEFRFPDTTKEQRENIIIQKKITPEPYPEVNEKFVFYLVKDNVYKNAYTSLNDYQGRYKDNKQSKYERFVPDSERDSTYNVKNLDNVNNCSVEYMKNQLNK